MHEVEVKGILSARNGMNLYRGCSHGCIYCDSRSTCYQMNHVFEDIEVKRNCLEVLESELRRKRTKCMISTGAMSDPYLPLERTLQYTRKSLELIRDLGFGATVLTKSDLVLRDLDVIEAIHRSTRFVLQMTLTTYDESLCAILEPHVASTRRRFEVLQRFREAGIPTVVWLSPILPFINDTKENLEGILTYCNDAGVKGIICFDMGVTLRSGDREYFYAALDRHFPGLKERYIQTYGNAYSLLSPNHPQLMAQLKSFCRENNMLCRPDQVFAYLSEFEEKNRPVQLSFFTE
ncbi:radical SAM protein [Proteiniclasticum sp. QWL-01]|uniref:SPL family radical SAM protein n=1 Tax=Proteiniclasticum sp. QWL-01 TaxID=3036945 RepID=UPI00240ECC6D|nr:radical SAM protein [Proteiniclasticum sp. QWL-01]WFF73012.1 radical SAM protein [Proteiniclasticum sp. QWL-01]